MVSCVWQFDIFKQPLFYQAPSSPVRKPFPTAAAKGSELCPYGGHWLQRAIQRKKRVVSPSRIEVPPIPLQNLLPFSKGKKSHLCLCPALPPPPPMTWLMTLLMPNPHGIRVVLPPYQLPVAWAWVASQESTAQVCFPTFLRAGSRGELGCRGGCSIRVLLSLISPSSQIWGQWKGRTGGCGEEQRAGAELHVWG